MDLLKNDLKRIPLLLVGFVFLSFGIMLTKRADLGMNAWGIFHDGLSGLLEISFGSVTLFFGFIVLGFSMWFLKTKVGIGTILNVLVVGLMIDLSDLVFTYNPSSITDQIVILVAGTLMLTFGRSLYISTNLGAGPRDGLFVGLCRITKIDVKYVKPAIEFSVLIIGVLLGGKIGVGTIFLIIVSGYLIEIFFKLLNYNPKEKQQRRFIDYFPQKEKGTN